MAILSNGKFYGFLCSAKETGRKLTNGAKEYVENFVSGFAGHGWKIWEYVKGKWMLEIDSIRVRGQFTVFEMLISKVRAIIGAQAITQGCGKIKSVELSEDGVAYLITLEDKDMSFMEYDFIRCQEFTGEQRTYHVEIESVNGGVIRIPLSEFDEDEGGFVQNPPKPGDDIVQFGNSSHDEKYTGRHSAIYMHADEGVPPAIDVLDGIYSKDWSNCLKVRMGGDIPGSNGLKGLYCVNGMIRGVDDTGHMTYCLYPDGTAELGDGSALFKPDKSGYIAGGAIAWRCEDGKDKYIVSMNDVQVEWDKIKDTPGWIDEWTANGTTIGEKFVASPTGFFGKKDSDTDKLTGILMGKDVLVNGVERTGIFALVDDEVVFELDPENKEYQFNGRIEANKGKIGGFVITSTGLENEKSKSAIISATRKDLIRTVMVNNQEVKKYSERKAILGNALSAIVGFDVSSYISATAEDDCENTALMLNAQGSTMNFNMFGGKANLAIRAYGGVNWHMAKEDHWAMPGFLLGATFYIDPQARISLQGKWGNGCDIINYGGGGTWGTIKVIHDLKHTDYYVQVVPYEPTHSGDWWGIFASLSEKTADYVTIVFRTDSGGHVMPRYFDIMFFGRPNDR